MTMPYGSTEEPDVEHVELASVPVHVVSSDAKPGRAPAPEFGRWRTVLVNTQIGQDSAVPGAKRLANRSLRRHRILIAVSTTGPVTSTPVVTAVPNIATSGTAVQNPNGVPVSVTLAGFTATQVFVNGILVGASNGTYIVPAYGSISVTFTVVGTTATAGIAASNPQPATDGVIVGGREEIQALITGGGTQAQVSPLAGLTPGGFLPIGINVRYESQQELWVAYPSTNAAAVIVTTCDEVYASDAPKE